MIILIIFIILFIEIYSLMINRKVNQIYLEKSDIKSGDYTENESKDSFEIGMKRGNIYTVDDCNLFIIINNKPELMKKNVVYQIKQPYILKYVKVNEKSIKYFYN